MVAMLTGDKFKLVKRYSERRIIDDLQKRIPGIKGHGQAVWFGYFAEPVESGQSAGACHVLENYRWLTSNMT